MRRGLVSALLLENTKHLNPIFLHRKQKRSLAELDIPALPEVAHLKVIEWGQYSSFGNLSKTGNVFSVRRKEGFRI